MGDEVVSEGIYAGMLRNKPETHTSRKSPAEGSIANSGTSGLAFKLAGATDFLRDSGIVVGTDELFAQAADDEQELMKKLKKQGKVIRQGSTVKHREKGTIYVVLKTNVDIHASGKPRHLVVEHTTGNKYKIVETKLKAI